VRGGFTSISSGIKVGTDAGGTGVLQLTKRAKKNKKNALKYCMSFILVKILWPKVFKITETLFDFYA